MLYRLPNFGRCSVSPVAVGYFCKAAMFGVEPRLASPCFCSEFCLILESLVCKNGWIMLVIALFSTDDLKLDFA